MKNLHKTELGWFVWIERTINDIQMMWKSIMWISLGSLGVILISALITTSIGLYETDLSFEFYLKFFKLSFSAITDAHSRGLWWDAIEAIGFDILKLFIVHSVFGGYFAWIIFNKMKSKSVEMSETKYIKGTKLVAEADRIQEINKKILAGEIKSRLQLGRIPLPYNVESNHVLIIAGSGGGKGVLLSKVMNKIGKLKQAHGLVHDIKPEWILYSYRPERGDLIFNPMDQRSIKYTVFNDLLIPGQEIVLIKNFCSWVVPPNPAAKDPFWDDSARQILESIMIYLWKHDDCTNAGIRRMIHLSSEELAEELAGLPGAEYAAKKDSLSTLKTKMQWVDFMPDGDFSIAKWFESENGLLFLSNTERTQALFKPVLSLFVNSVGSYVLNLTDDRDRRFFFFLDEFTALSRLDKVIELLKLGRSKGASL